MARTRGSMLYKVAIDPTDITPEFMSELSRIVADQAWHSYETMPPDILQYALRDLANEIFLKDMTKHHASVGTSNPTIHAEMDERLCALIAVSLRATNDAGVLNSIQSGPERCATGYLASPPKAKRPRLCTRCTLL